MNIGNELYTSLSRLSKQTYLLLIELPEIWYMCLNVITIYNTVQVLLAQYMTYVPWETLITSCTSFEDAIQALTLQNYISFLLTIGCTTVGIYCIDVCGYKIFDSHSRDVHGMAHPQGTCVLLEVPTLCELKNYFQTLHTNSDSLFELGGIKIDTDQCYDTDTLTDQPEQQSNIGAILIIIMHILGIEIAHRLH